ncbi:50S ribosomal protein L11 [Candidatus Similichlamydia laticola]|uniref:Large ribosomal subunit protein uL11 n=1 Tax=Candidatus Similichlamydia laticola TaxID=2170265 RepID=A0A369KAS0_9BACT|nr:50S ribosomal protein L11 [Candidatus Similichlamydia laticola]RDB31701.1 LSU ribosomal protein L11p (L12e) [Candidatus Similichlamydia laticola]
MSQKNHSKIIRLQIVAGKALPSPPVGPALGAVGVNIMAFCKAFNERTRGLGDALVTAVIYVDLKKKDFRFEIRKPPVSYLIKKALGLEKGAKSPNREKGATITLVQLEQVAKEKMEDLFANSLEAAVRIVSGSARSMGIEVVK